jgi:hypothetical protein
MRRAAPVAEGMPLCIECRDRCIRGVGAAEAARRRANPPPPDWSEQVMARCGTLYSLGIARATP